MRRALTLAFCLLCGSAFAQEGVRWHYVAPPECPTEQQFRDQVGARLLRDPGTSDTAKIESGAGVSVEVRLEPAERRASLVLKEPGAPVLERAIEGDSCAELASGLALITALAFGAAEDSAGKTGADLPRAAEPVDAAPANAPAPIVSEPRRSESGVVKPGKEDRGGTPTPASDSPTLGMEVGAGGWVNTWSTPNGGLGADVFLRMAPQAPGWSLRLAGLYGFGASYVGDRLAEFTFVGGRAEGCPISRGLPLKLLGEACLALDLGALRGSGEDTSLLLEGTSRTVFWAAGVIVGRIRAPLSGRVSVEGQAELGLPLVRHEFVFEEPRERIFRIPTAGFAARAGLGVEFL